MNRTIARAAILWGSGVLHAATAIAEHELGNVPAAILYAVAALGCIAAGRWMA